MDQDQDEDDEEDDGLVTVLWGTTVTIGASMKAFERFLKEFTCEDRQSFDPWRLEQVRRLSLSYYLRKLTSFFRPRDRST